MPKVKAPFPYFGGKSRSADKIWEAIGDPKIFIEPFMGSAAVSLARPDTHKNNKLILNDSASFVCNFYRALIADPEGVMKWCAYPRFEQDMHARHRWIVLSDESKALQEKVRKDPDYYDVKLAGWWVYGINMWIGDKWGVAVKRVKSEEPHPGRENNRPTNMQKGIHCKEYEEDVGDKKPMLKMSGVHANELQANTNSKLLAFLNSVAAKLRYARILNGDWKRVFTESEIATTSVGVFLDPPYDGHADFYGKNDVSINEEVRNWCIEYGQRKNFKIVLSGYGEDNDVLLAHGWTKQEVGKECGMSKKDKRVEYIWISPTHAS